MQRTLFAMLAAAALSSAAASAWSQTPAAADAGAIPDRVIRITDQTRYVNVTRDETVRFLVADAKGRETSFVRRFDHSDRRVFPLTDIAPAGVLGEHRILVYIQRTPPAD